MKSMWLWIKQVHNLFIVDFKIACLNQELHLNSVLFCLPLLLFHASKNVLKRALHYASKFVCFLITILSTNDMIFILYWNCRSLYSIGFSRASLTIGKDWSVVSLKTWICYWHCNLFEYLDLSCVRICNIIEGKLLLVESSIEHNFFLVSACDTLLHCTSLWNCIDKENNISINCFLTYFLFRSRVLFWWQPWHYLFEPNSEQQGFFCSYERCCFYYRPQTMS